jgi:hypothetical protein
MRDRDASAAVAEMEDLLQRAHRHYLSQLEKPVSIARKVSAA